ncbi:metallophosphoesterase [Rothia uropygioeca]|uniref:metallophosphoesterase n=1 Tax=Kocuria sp. 257 TaxID=2021970 RepID=UPI001010B8C9|nr:metallophosphoesterase [Kocuria sp. 257]
MSDRDNAGTSQGFATTSSRRVIPDAAAPFRRLHPGPGEPHTARTDLMPANAAWPDAGTQVLGLVHFTDFQLADLASPARLEFLQKLDGQPDWKGMTPSYRPQEFLQYHAIEGMVRAMNSLVEAQPDIWDLALTTGDNSDSSQRNEIEAYLRSLTGGVVKPAAGSREFQDAPVGMDDPQYYNPEPSSRDRYKTEFGFPDAPGALSEATRSFGTDGLGLPWLTCFGNHDCLVQGRASLPAGLDDFLSGPRKPIELDAASAPEGAKTPAYVNDPMWSTRGPTKDIDPSDGRTVWSKSDYVRAHLDSPGSPRGHGFTDVNLHDGVTYYAHDPNDDVRILVLDTTNTAGHVDGCVDDTQFRWLRDQLDASAAESRIVVLASHHGLSTLNNDYGIGDSRGTLHLADDVEALLHCYPNVVLWLSGHTHVNKVTPRPGRAPENGFWEVSTAAISEWPVQFRGVQIFVSDSVVRIRTTMVDSQIPESPTSTRGLENLAALHRELGANDTGSVGGLHAEGTRDDRNVDLLVAI